MPERNVLPKPIQQPHPPIVIGGSGEQLTLRVVARYADVWNASGADVETFRHKLRVLHDHCAAVGRDPIVATDADLAGYEIAWRDTTADEWTDSVFIGTVTNLVSKHPDSRIVAGSICSARSRRRSPKSAATRPWSCSRPRRNAPARD